MTQRTNDGGPAFPRIDALEDYGNGVHGVRTTGGMSLRDYFAAKAMQGMCSNFEYLTACVQQGRSDDEVAMDAYKMADAMLAARERGA